MKDQKILLQNLKNYWFNEEEIGKILRWLKDSDEWRFCTMEEVYNNLGLKTNKFANEHNFYDISKWRFNTNQKIHFYW